MTSSVRDPFRSNSLKRILLLTEVCRIRGVNLMFFLMDLSLGLGFKFENLKRLDTHKNICLMVDIRSSRALL